MIEINHSHINITNYTIGKCNTLEKNLSVWDSVSFKNSWTNFFYNEQTKELKIPRGINIKKLQKWLYLEDLQVNTKPNQVGAANFKCTVNPRDEKQEEAIKFLIGETDETRDTTERMLCLQTGGGKTYCTINALSKIKARTMIIVDKEKIMKQWKDEFLKFTNIKEEDIYLISGRQSIEILRHMKKTDIRSKVFIAMHQTIGSFMGDDSNVLNDLFNKLKIGVTVFDEAHCYASSMFQINFRTNTKLTIYLTATPNRSNNFEDKVYQESLSSVPKFGLEDKFSDPYHNIYYISYDSKPTYTQTAKCQTKRGFDTNTFSDYTFNNKYEQLYSIICKLLGITLKNPNFGKTCIIVHKNEHIVKLKKDLEADFPGIDIGTFCGLVSDAKKREKELEKKIILSTDKSMGKAIDVKDLQFVIMTVPTSSVVIAEQTLGRLRKLENREVMYFDLTDTGFKTCCNQRNLRRKVLDQKAKSIKLLSL